MARENSIKLNISPFGLVLLVTLMSLILSVLSGNSKEYSLLERIVTSLQYWRLGFFGFLDFTLQMIMVLVFGYCLAIFKPVHAVLKRIAHAPKNQLQAVFLTALITFLSGLINWGFGLIIGAVLTRFMAISPEEQRLLSNPVLLA